MWIGFVPLRLWLAIFLETLDASERETTTESEYVWYEYVGLIVNLFLREIRSPSGMRGMTFETCDD